LKHLITGTAGFIGFHLARKLLERGDTVIGLDNINDYYDVNVKYGRLDMCGIKKSQIEYNQKVQSTVFENYQFIKLNLEDREAIDTLFKNESFDSVTNLAAQAGVRYSITNPHAYIGSNIVGFMNILEACRHFKVSRLSYASSSSVYGLNEAQPFSTNDSTNHPMSLYAASKKSNEMMAHTYSHLYNLPTTGLRFFTVYGPWGRPDMALFLFTKAMLEGKSIDVFNHGEMQRDFTYVDDIVNGIIKVIDNPAKSDKNWNPQNPQASSSSAPYKIYNIGNNAPVKLMDFVNAIEKELGIEAKKNLLPIQAGDVPSTFANVEDLIDDLGYQPQTSVKEGIHQFITWYRSFFKV
jgi:UDP-glucuronate 4-epimerase